MWGNHLPESSFEADRQKYLESLKSLEEEYGLFSTKETIGQVRKK
jgi:hypothetical protein